jgi:hypothetical protein
MATQRLGQFSTDTVRARDLVGLGQSIGGLTQGRVDSSDLYRSALVQAVAALDAYVHGVVLDRAVDMLVGRLQTTGTTTKVGLHFNAVQALLTAGSAAQVELAARTHIAQRLALETFQRPDDIAKALSMVGVGKIWSTAFAPNSNAITTALGIIVDRRNRIVHSCDIDPLNPGNVTPLTDTDALQVVGTIERIATQIDPLC